MEQFIKYSLIVHVIAGFGALIFGALTIILKSKTPKHKKVGKVYFYCMTIIFITGIYISLYKNIIFLFLIAIFTYYFCCTAYRALKLKGLNITQKPKLIDWLINSIAGITFIGMIVFAIVMYFNIENSNFIIPLVFGIMGMFTVYQNLKRLFSKPKHTLVWLKVHIGNMCVSYIGAITAFVVNQSQHIPLPAPVLWLGPTAIILPIIILETKKVKSVKISEN